MSEPNVEQIITAGKTRATKIQKVSMQSKPEPEVAVDDPQVKNLVESTGMSPEEAYKLITDLKRMWG